MLSERALLHDLCNFSAAAKIGVVDAKNRWRQHPAAPDRQSCPAPVVDQKNGCDSATGTPSEFHSCPLGTPSRRGVPPSRADTNAEGTQEPATGG
jgi:hypothetical protein